MADRAPQGRPARSSARWVGSHRSGRRSSTSASSVRRTGSSSRAVQALRARGIAVVAAVGNDGRPRRRNIRHPIRAWSRSPALTRGAARFRRRQGAPPRFRRARRGHGRGAAGPGICKGPRDELCRAAGVGPAGAQRLRRSASPPRPARARAASGAASSAAPAAIDPKAVAREVVSARRDETANSRRSPCMRVEIALRTLKGEFRC